MDGQGRARATQSRDGTSLSPPPCKRGSRAQSWRAWLRAASGWAAAPPRRPPGRRGASVMVVVVYLLFFDAPRRGQPLLTVLDGRILGGRGGVLPCCPGRRNRPHRQNHPPLLARISRWHPSGRARSRLSLGSLGQPPCRPQRPDAPGPPLLGNPRFLQRPEDFRRGPRRCEDHTRWVHDSRTGRSRPSATPQRRTITWACRGGQAVATGCPGAAC